MPREVFNARTLIVASSIVAIPIIAGSLYVTIYQKRRRRRTKALSIDSGGEPKQRKTEKIIPMQSLDKDRWDCCSSSFLYRSIERKINDNNNYHYYFNRSSNARTTAYFFRSARFN
jgi:hypothetical protein